MPKPAVRPHFFVLAALFVASFAAGALAPTWVRTALVGLFQAATEPLGTPSGGGIFLFILVNNLIATWLMLLLGVAFGILPVVGVGFNGFIVGALCREGARVVGYAQTAFHVLPHGVFEIPALLLAAAYGLWIGVAALQRVRGRGGLEIRYQLGYAIRRYVAIVGYLAWRFDFKFGVAATIATFHDVFAMVGLFYLFGKEIDLLFITALLTIAGYSRSDTVVIFDRIRENIRLRKRETFSATVNLSINEVLSRTIITSLTTFLACVSLLFFGGIVLKDFALALTIGLVVGTYSSIFVASPIVAILRGERMAEVKG